MNERSVEARIAASPLFSGLPADDIAFLARHAKLRTLEPGEVLFRYGERARHFYLVESGHVTVEVAAVSGPALELQNLGPGLTLGWSWLIPPHKWNFQARAQTAAEVIEFDGEALRARCEQDPRFGYEVLKRFAALMSERLEFARRKMMEAWNPPGFA
ncbi:MAG TPA: cyclic nucleotide-binding domain-containing protein [Gammaproteobacteria bacterium]